MENGVDQAQTAPEGALHCLPIPVGPKNSISGVVLWKILYIQHGESSLFIINNLSSNTYMFIKSLYLFFVSRKTLYKKCLR